MTARIVAAECSPQSVYVRLSDRRTLTTPLEWYPRLMGATQKQRENIRIIGGGTGIHWPDLDEDLSLAGMLAGMKGQP